MDSTTTAKAALSKAAAVLGSQAAIAEACGYEDRRHVWPWFNTDRPTPAEKCADIEKATSLRGEPVYCEELRPDIAWARIADKSWPWHKRGRPVLDVTRAAA